MLTVFPTMSKTTCEVLLFAKILTRRKELIKSFLLIVKLKGLSAGITALYGGNLPSIKRQLSPRNTVRLYSFQDLLSLLVVSELRTERDKLIEEETLLDLYG